MSFDKTRDLEEYPSPYILVVSGKQPLEQICPKIEVISFPSSSERGPLGSRAFLLKKGGVVLRAMRVLLLYAYN